MSWCVCLTLGVIYYYILLYLTHIHILLYIIIIYYYIYILFINILYSTFLLLLFCSSFLSSLLPLFHLPILSFSSIPCLIHLPSSTLLPFFPSSSIFRFTFHQFSSVLLGSILYYTFRPIPRFPDLFLKLHTIIYKIHPDLKSSKSIPQLAYSNISQFPPDPVPSPFSVPQLIFPISVRFLVFLISVRILNIHSIRVDG